MKAEKFIDFCDDLGIKTVNCDQIEKQAFAYSIIFLIENFLRVTMHNIMYVKKGANCFKETIFPAFKRGKFEVNIVKNAAQRKRLEKDYNLDMGYNYPGFWYLDYPILIGLLDSFWDQFFCEIFINPKQIKVEIISRLKIIAPIRNAIAHHRYISNIDLVDLRKTAVILYKYLDKNKLNNFNSVALSTAEENLKTISELIDYIERDLIKGNCITQKRLDFFKNVLGAFIIQKGQKELLFQNELIIGLLEEYNKLPRKPGRGKEIKEFLRNRGLIQKMTDLLLKLGG